MKRIPLWRELAAAQRNAFKAKTSDNLGTDVVRAPPCPSCGAKYYHAHFSWCAITPARIHEAKVA